MQHNSKSASLTDEQHMPELYLDTSNRAREVALRGVNVFSVDIAVGESHCSAAW
jgi:hypothetical protein